MLFSPIDTSASYTRVCGAGMRGRQTFPRHRFASCNPGLLLWERSSDVRKLVLNLPKLKVQGKKGIPQGFCVASAYRKHVIIMILDYHNFYSKCISVERPSETFLYGYILQWLHNTAGTFCWHAFVLEGTTIPGGDQTR
jgi:hypothetical protein